MDLDTTKCSSPPCMFMLPLSKDKEDMNFFRYCDNCFATKFKAERQDEVHISPEEVHHCSKEKEDMNIFRCSYCDKCFSTKNNAETHEKLAHISPEEVHPCSICSLAFKSKGNLTRHIRIIHEGNSKKELVFTCGFCGKKFNTNFSKRRHEHKFHDYLEQVKFPCRKCSVLLRSEPSRIKHENEVHAKLKVNMPKSINENIQATMPNRIKHENEVHAKLKVIMPKSINKNIQETIPKSKNKNIQKTINRNEIHNLDVSGNLYAKNFRVVPKSKNKNIQTTINRNEIHNLDVSGNLYAKNFRVGAKLICNFCPESFSNLSQKYKHIRMEHASLGVFVCECQYCGKRFKTKSQKKKHEKGVHGVPYAIEKKTNVKCVECDINFITIQSLREHRATIHEEDMNCNILHFKDMNVFQKWKEDLEKEKEANYVSLNKSTKLKKIYYCRRSGPRKKYIPHEDHKKRRFSNGSGSIKLGMHCTATIEVTTNPNSEEVTVKYYGMHYGHNIGDITELRYLKLPEDEKTAIIRECEKGIPDHQILQNIQARISGNDPLHLVTKKTIENMKKKIKRLSNAPKNKEEVELIGNLLKDSDKTKNDYEPLKIKESCCDLLNDADSVDNDVDLEDNDCELDEIMNDSDKTEMDSKRLKIKEYCCDIIKNIDLVDNDIDIVNNDSAIDELMILLSKVASIAKNCSKLSSKPELPVDLKTIVHH